MSSILIQLAIGTLILCAEVYFNAHLREQVPMFDYLYQSSETTYGMPRAYGLIPISLVVAGFTIQIIGFMVGAARSKIAEKAKAQGDKDAEKRFKLPKMYAEGFSDLARDFNNLQRGHQNPLESIALFLIVTLIGGCLAPLTCSLNAVLWAYARYEWAQSYKVRGPEKRFAHPLSGWVWISLLVNMFSCIGVGVKMLAF